MFKFRIKKYLKRTDFMNSVDTNKIWSKKVTIPETLDIIEQLENELANHKFKKDNKSKIISFDSIRFEQGTEGLVGKSLMPLYRFLSIHGHPSFLGVLQFAQMFNTNDDIKFQRILLIIASKLASIVAIDFRDNIIGAKEIYDNLPETEKKNIQVCYVN